ncbi:MAG: ribonuclease G [Thiotrichales bacterium]|jgi:ribonuclease G|nr:ribonuclease G [Thiotrichales bacterium]MBT3613137.1 ribonuclease G [Thiotrichales bacterium]MBT3752811.1 ribonuclease G [Thiotrichales bacterium]MBT3838199.1 ribonuclease G [Thiotrichales bacterium]MBT4152186.1 ribonuclease G [Thiotrichales bacterium]
MSIEILINVTPQETRSAMVEDGVLQELYVERGNHLGIVGNIYKGKVNRVLPGMQAAFVDIGLERSAFLHASDVLQLRDSVGGAEDIECSFKEEPISELISTGDELLVQVVKDPLGSKGARLTMQVSIPSRYLVFLPAISCRGISRRIEEEDERERLYKIIDEFAGIGGYGGFIVRTAGDGVPVESLQHEAELLYKIWESIKERAPQAKSRTLLHKDLPLEQRIIRDQLKESVERVRIDSRIAYEQGQKFASQFTPEFSSRVEYYQGECPIFDLYSVEDEIQRALQRSVPLKSGGYLIIDQTEAMTTIDVNTGSFVGHSNLEETTFKTNLEATKAIARQLRLRNLGGIIILDLIDMDDRQHREQVIRSLEKALEQDHARTHISTLSELGLIEMTRKRTRESIEHILCETCPTCDGRGYIKTAETVCYEIFREIIRESRQYEDSKEFLVLASQEITDLLLDEESANLAGLEEFINKPVRLQPESMYPLRQFDVVPVS